uniref:PAS domain-containing protein n=1 Tax=Romanomermis culicivorax TaxID=13658 RepID=A0A915K3F9_ROMCU
MRLGSPSANDVNGSLEHAFSQMADITTGQTNCLVAIGRIQLCSMSICEEPTNEFTTRHTQDGKFSFVGEGVASLLGYKPSELLGKFWWDFVHNEDKPNVRALFEQCKLVDRQHCLTLPKVLKTKDQQLMVNCRFPAKAIPQNSGSSIAESSTSLPAEWVPFQTNAYTFNNPYSDEFEYIVATHRCLNNQTTSPSNSATVGPSHEQFQQHTTTVLPPRPESHFIQQHQSSQILAPLAQAYSYDHVTHSSEPYSMPDPNSLVNATLLQQQLQDSGIALNAPPHQYHPPGVQHPMLVPSSTGFTESSTLETLQPADWATRMAYNENSISLAAAASSSYHISPPHLTYDVVGQQRNPAAVVATTSATATTQAQNGASSWYVAAAGQPGSQNLIYEQHRMTSSGLNAETSTNQGHYSTM